MELIKVSTLNSLNRQVKGILLHSGIFTLGDILPHKTNNYGSLVTDPELSQEQVENLAYEIDRVEQIFTKLVHDQPLDFSFSGSRKAAQSLMPASGFTSSHIRRECIFLMREIADVRSVRADDSQDHFLDVVFGLGEVTEVCGLCSTGKTQICF
jgi:hypothetical protein